MLFLYSDNRILPVQIASYLKAPYVTNNLNILESNCDPYNMLHNTLYFIIKKNRKTYFYLKNNLIKYHNEDARKQNSFIISDIENGVYKLIRFNKLKHKIYDYISFIIKGENGKWYIITENTTCRDGSNCCAVIDAQNGRELCTVSRESSLYELILYGMANRVVPIIQAPKTGLFVYLFDLSKEKCKKSALDLNTLKSLILKLLTKPQEYKHMINDIIKNSIEEITTFRISKVYYNNKVNENGVDFIDEIIVKMQFILWDHVRYYEYCLDNLMLKIKLEDNSIILYISLEEAYVYIEKKLESERMPMIYFSKYTNNLSILLDRYEIDKIFNGIYYTNLLYMDKCYYILGYENGIVVLDRWKHSWGLTDQYLASLHRHKKYLFIINEQLHTKLTVIDLESKSIGVWSSEHSEAPCLNYRTTYDEYYSKKNNKMILVSHNSNCLILIDLPKVEKFLNYTKNNKCEEFSYHEDDFRKVDEVVEEFKLSDLIKDTIMKTYKNNGHVMIIEPLGHYIDKKRDSIYFAFKYKMSYKHKRSEDYIGIFVCRIYGGRVYCELIESKYIGNIDSKNIISIYNRKRNMKKSNYPISISNIEPYMLNNMHSNSIVNLDIAYKTDNGDYFISFKYNRRSYKLPQRLEFGDNENIKHRVIQSGNIIWIKEINGVEEYGVFCFILNDMSISGLLNFFS